eukprot:Pgem_evm2s18496
MWFEGKLPSYFINGRSEKFTNLNSQVLYPQLRCKYIEKNSWDYDLNYTAKRRFHSGYGKLISDNESKSGSNNQGTPKLAFPFQMSETKRDIRNTTTQEKQSQKQNANSLFIKKTVKG